MNTEAGRGVAVVTGAGSGIGAAIAAAMAESGLAVAVVDVNLDAAQKVVDEVDAPALAIACDVTQRDSVSAAFDSVDKHLGPVTVLVNNAGISRDRALKLVGDDDWEATMAVNLTGVMLCTQAATKVMVPRRFGRVVNIGSRSWLGWYGQSSYSASKGGVVSLTRANAVELAKFGVTVNCIAPGLIDTPLLRAEPAEVMEKLIQAQPTGTIGRPEDVARAARYLALQAGQAVTGQVLYVCGGKSIYAQPAL
jgi:3-oxoacyl-[acyl-carrier protein] reductase